jgi:uncharacterized membrane protein YdjX (TVP38/TMEM64 family)/rhodanese-related sulfurtransferase
MTVRAVLSRLVLGLALSGAVIWVALNRDRVDPAVIESLIRDLGLWAPLAHVVLFAVATVLFVPGAIVGLAGGALFGPLWGAILNLIGATLGATAAFLAARYLAADWVRHKAGGRIDRLISGVEAEGWRFVAFVRLVPLFPFNLLNYALGLTRIPVTHYILASLVCMAPGTLAYAWLGYAGREALAGSDSAIRFGLIALGLLATMAFLPRLVRRLRENDASSWIEADELAVRLEDGNSIAVIDVRGPDEFAGPLGHIADARNLPIGEFPHQLHELETLKDKPIVLVCRTDKRSGAGAALLRHAGFRDVRVLRGGMEQWNQSGLPVDEPCSEGRSTGACAPAS